MHVKLFFLALLGIEPPICMELNEATDTTQKNRFSVFRPSVFQIKRRFRGSTPNRLFFYVLRYYGLAMLLKRHGVGCLDCSVKLDSRVDIMAQHCYSLDSYGKPLKDRSTKPCIQAVDFESQATGMIEKNIVFRVVNLFVIIVKYNTV